LGSLEVPADLKVVEGHVGLTAGLESAGGTKVGGGLHPAVAEISVSVALSLEAQDCPIHGGAVETHVAFFSVRSDAEIPGKTDATNADHLDAAFPLGLLLSRCVASEKGNGERGGDCSDFRQRTSIL